MKRVLAAALALLFLAAHPPARGAAWEYARRVEGTLGATGHLAPGGDDAGGGVAGQLRLGGTADRGDLIFQGALALDAGGRWGWPETGRTPRRRTTPLRAVDAKTPWARGGSGEVGGQLDRLLVEARWSAATLIVGRQAIGNGSGRVMNAGDIFTPVTPQATFTEYKTGVDAARLSYLAGESLEVEAIAVAHETGWEKSYLLGRAVRRLPGADVAVVAGRTLGEPTVGVDLALDGWGGAGWYFDSIARLGRTWAEGLRATLGVHTRLVEAVDGLLELHYNGPGAPDPARYWRTPTTEEYRNGELTLLGEYYLAGEVDWEVNPLVRVAATAMVNLVDRSALLLPVVQWWAADEVAVRGGCSVGVGGHGGTEFGAYPDMAFLEVVFAL